MPLSSRLPPRPRRERERRLASAATCLRARAGKSQGTLSVWGHPIKAGSEAANGGDGRRGEKGGRGGEGADPLDLLPALT